MAKSIVKIIENELVVGTWELSLGFKVDHRSLKNIILKYRSEIEEVGERPILSEVFSAFYKCRKDGQKRPKGRPTKEYILNEPQATYLTMLLQNNEIVRKFKRQLTKEFFRMRKILIKLIVQKQNAEWLQKREAGMIERRIETDTIKEFVEYAKKQGSAHAEKYYMAISKMENNTLFNLEYVEQKFPNLRDVVNGFALDTLKMADHAVSRALKEGMKDSLPYKEIFSLAKNRVELFASVIGRTPLSQILNPELPSTPRLSQGNHKTLCLS